MSKTVIVSNRLPVKVSKTEQGFEFKPSEGGLATGLGSIYKQGDNLWIGWPGVDIAEEQEQAAVKKDLAAQKLVPVFLTQEEINLYYEGFSNETLWPIFHYFPTYAHYEQSYWEAYIAVNKKFCNALLQILDPEDTVWVHDYQLLLLPGMIRAERPDVTIGFFLHIPFPSFEIFRLIPWRAEILKGMLGADLLGLHTYDDARHLLSSITRLLPVHSSANIISVDERSVVVESFPMGIDAVKFENMTRSKEVLDNIDRFKATLDNFKIILSIDRLDYSKGILQRLQAFDSLLQGKPEYREKAILYMIVVPSRDTVPQYKELRDEIDKLVGSINARYRTLNWLPVHYYYRSFPTEELSALYHLADICLVTPMRDGMNLVCKEYVASRTMNDGVLILSEMAGAAKELVDALIVNPNNTQEICRTILQALEMPLEEQQKRMKQMRDLVSKFNIRHWVNIYMDRLREVKQLQESLYTRHAGTLVKEQIEKQYAAATNRIIFLDYDGTLVGFNASVDQALPDAELYDILQRLTSDPANEIVVVSGRKQENLEEWFGRMKLDLIAEHGAWSRKNGDDWQKSPGLSDLWKQDVYPVLETFTDRTPGSFIEEKTFSLVWHYRKVQPGLGELRANELITNLRLFASDKGLQLLQGNKVIEIKNMEINKGKAVLSWLEEKPYDFIMAFGDDHTDEDIFKVLPEDAFSIKIGSNISTANYYLRDHVEVRNLLKGLASRPSSLIGNRSL